MEVKIGVREVPREVVLETDSSHDEVAAAVKKSLDSGALLRLTDTHGRVILIPSAMIGYVEIGAPEQRKVGFGAL